MKIYLFFTLFFILVYCSFSFSQDSDIESIGNFKKDIIAFSSDTVFANSSISFYAIDINSGEIIGQINPNLLLSPASTMKIFTTATALEILGPDHTFKTDFEYTGNIEKGVLHGNVYIKGGGDPTFYSHTFTSLYNNPDVFSKVAEEIKKAGIKKIDGKIIGNASYYSDNTAPSTWILADVANYYGASPFALSFQDNEYKIFFKTGDTIGDSTWINSVYPNIPNLELYNLVKSKNINDDQSVIYGGLYDDYRIVTGNLPLNKNNFEVKGSIPDPPLFAAYSLLHVIKQHGIEVSDSVCSVYEFKHNTNLESNLRSFYSVTSPPVKEIVYHTNIRSINLYAEHLLRQIGVKKAGKGSNQSGIESICNYWKPYTGKFLMYDGSGLSRFNAVSAKQLVTVLTYMKKQSKHFDPFYNSLPIASRSGSLTSMFNGTIAENNLRAKSGYMSGVRSYAGYVKTKSSREISFAIIVNNYFTTPAVVKSKIEQLLVKLSSL